MDKKNEIALRPYQQECEDIIEQKGDGRWLVAISTGLGKTVIFTHMKRHGRTLILSHRDELVRQPQKYYGDDVTFGVEKATEHADKEDVVSASVQSLSKMNRMKRYKPDDFDTIIIDEAHHAAAPSYRKILDYFSGAKRRIGFTATPKRGDKVRLTDIFDEIIFERDLRWGINNGYLSRIRSLSVTSNYDLSKVRKVAGDFSEKDLEKVMDESGAIMSAARTYIEECHNTGRHTLIYCVTKRACFLLADTINQLLPKSEAGTVAVLTGDTPDDERKKILDGFQDGNILCIINCMVLTEGTDLPICDAILNLRPTCNPSLYQQVVGRACRLYPGKDYALVIDIEPAGGARSLCTAPTLFGIDPEFLGKKKKAEFNRSNDLLELCDGLSEAYAEGAEKLTLQIEDINLFLSEREELIQKNMDKGLIPFARDLMKLEEKKRKAASKEWDFGRLVVTVQADTDRRYKITPSWNEAVYLSEPDVLGNTTVTFDLYVDPYNAKHSVQKVYVGNEKFEDAVNLIWKFCTVYRDSFSYIWDKDAQGIWADAPATEKQESKVRNSYRKTGIKEGNLGRMNKLDANILINTAGEMKDKEAERCLLNDAVKGTLMKSDASASMRASEKKRVENAAEMMERREKERELEIQSGKGAYPEFAGKVETAYTRMQEQIREQEEAAKSFFDEKGYYIDIDISGIYGRATRASDAQVNFIKNLVRARESLGDKIEGLNLQHMSGIQASGLIQILKYLERQPRSAQGRVFTDLEDWKWEIAENCRLCRVHYRFVTGDVKEKDNCKKKGKKNGNQK